MGHCLCLFLQSLQPHCERSSTAHRPKSAVIFKQEDPSSIIIDHRRRLIDYSKSQSRPNSIRNNKAGIMMNPYGMRPGIILLREGTDTSQVSCFVN